MALCDIDDFSLYSERIHVTGGLFGLVTIILDELLKSYNLTENTQENISLIASVLDEFIFKCLKENQIFGIKYLESERFNFSEPISEERRPEFIDFIHDYRRFVNKSLKVLIDQAQLPQNSLDLVLSAIVALYFKDKSAIPLVEVNAENQDPEYVEKIKQEQEDYVEAVGRLEAVKKKIKFVMVKPSVLKKRRENIAAFIQVSPALGVKETLTETDELPVTERPKTTHTAANLKSDENPNSEAIKAEDNEENNKENENNDNENAESKIGDSSNKNEGDNNAESESNSRENKAENENQNESSESNKQGAQNEGENAEENAEGKTAEENNVEANQTNNGDINSKGAESKNNPKVFKFEYANEAQIFKNINMKYEPYVIHHSLQEYSLINVAISFRRVIKKNLKIEADLAELINISSEAYNKYTQFVIDWIMNNEVYIKEKIVPITARPLETKIEEAAVPVSGVVINNSEGQLENIVNAENPGTNEEQPVA